MISRELFVGVYGWEVSPASLAKRSCFDASEMYLVCLEVRQGIDLDAASPSPVGDDVSMFPKPY